MALGRSVISLDMNDITACFTNYEVKSVYFSRGDN